MFQDDLKSMWRQFIMLHLISIPARLVLTRSIFFKYSQKVVHINDMVSGVVWVRNFVDLYDRPWRHMSFQSSQTSGKSTICFNSFSGWQKETHQSSTSLPLSGGSAAVTGEFPSQKANNAERVSMSIRRHISSALILLAHDLSLTATMPSGWWHNSWAGLLIIVLEATGR